jgi:hypothetical protein
VKFADEGRSREIQEAIQISQQGVGKILTSRKKLLMEKDMSSAPGV